MSDKDNTNSPQDMASSDEVQRIAKLVEDIKNSSRKSDEISSRTSDLKTFDLDPLESQDDGVKKPSNLETANNNFEQSYSKIKAELDDLVIQYLEKSNQIRSKKETSNPLRSEILSDFDKIIANTESQHSEIDIHSMLSNADAKKVRDLFTLLESELSSKTKKLKLSEIPKSNSKKIDHKNLEELFEELGDQIVDNHEIEKKEEVVPPIFSDDIPYPSFSRVLFAFIVDVVVIFLIELFAVSRYEAVQFSLDALLALVSENMALFIGMFFAFWFIIQAVSLIFTQGTLGASLMRIIVATKENISPSILRLLTRLSLHLFNFLSAGLYSNLLINKFLAKDQKGFYCPISKTKLTFKGFIRQ